MPKQRITADDLVRKMAESLKGGQSVKSRTQTAAAGDAGTQGGQSFKNPMTTAGDLIVGGESGAAVRLGIGTDDQVLTLVSGSPAWADAAGGGGTGTGRYRQYAVVSDGSGGFDFIDDGFGSPVFTLEDLE